MLKLDKKSARVLFLLLLSGCGSLPASGPYSKDVINEASATNIEPVEEAPVKPPFKYALVDVTSGILPDIQNKALRIKTDTVAWPEEGRPEIIHVNVGDTVSITIYEAQSGGLFVPTEAGVRPGNFVTLPAQTIDSSGVITVPYVGVVNAAGRTTNAISNAIIAGLKGRAIEPQVVVSVLERNSSEVSVVGQVKSAKKIVLGYNGDTILDAIAQAGGPDVPGYEAYVSLQRDGTEHTIPFDDLVNDPRKNLYLKSKDTVYIFKQPQTYTVYGASELKGLFPFERRDLFLAEALGKAGGLRDSHADPSEIYVYREEPVEIIDAMGIELDPLSFNNEIGPTIPVIYKINLRKPDGFFLSQKFNINDKDIIYIANAESVEFTKFLDLLNSTASTKTNSDNAFFPFSK